MEILEKILNALSIAPVWVSIFFFLGLAVYRKDRKILQNRMDSIESHLTNHVTGTEKQIAQLRIGTEKQIAQLRISTEKQIAQLRIDINDKFDKIDDKFDKIDNKFEKTDAKIDQLKTDMHMHFNTIILAVSGLTHKKNESNFKRNTE